MKQDYHCSGSGAITGGEYGEIRVSGDAKITGDVQCDRLHVSGGVKAANDLTCGEMHVSGSLKVEGRLSAETAKISGGVKAEHGIAVSGKLSLSCILKTEGNAELGEAGISGGATVEGKINAKDLRVSGGLKCGSDVSAEHFAASGKVEIPGLLNAETIELSASGRSEIGDIGCGSLTVRKERNVFFFGDAKPGLTVRSIEGDTIWLENTVAEIVRGKNVTVGKHCKIGRVEYSETLNLVDGGKVEEQVRG